MTHDVIQQLEAYGAHAEAVAPAISTDELDHRSAERIPTRTPQRRAFPNWAVAVGAAVAVFILIGGVVWLVGGSGSVVIDEPMPVTTAVAVTTTTTTPSAPVVVPDGWNPILATTKAKAAPPAATCPAGMNPNSPGVVDQARSEPGGAGNQAVAFDRHAGRIVHVDTANETWTFDVCTNTWQKMNPTGSPERDLGGGLVYDADSDRIISLSSTSGSAYDPDTNMWTRISDRPAMPEDHPTRSWIVNGAVYDPVSGLVLAQYGQDGTDWTVLSAYDVDTDRWTRVGQLEYRAWRTLIGYSSHTDQLVFAGEGGSVGVPLPFVVDPRTGTATFTERGASNVGFGPMMRYAADTDTAYVQTSDEEICWFDPGTLTWDSCFEAERQGFGAMVGDPINNRLVLISSAVWAVDLDTGEWSELLAPPTP